MISRRDFRIDRPNGIELDAVAQGPAKGTPFVMLHGLADSWHAFEPLLAHMPHDQPVIAISQRGHGASSKPDTAEAYRAKNFADDVLALLDHLGHERAYIVGHSMGAWVAFRFATLFGHRLAGLVLIGAFASFALNPGARELQRQIAALTDPVDPAFVREFQDAAGSPNLLPSFMEEVVTESMRLPAIVWQHLVESLMREDVPGNLTQIRAPALLIWGDQDSFVPGSDQDSLVRQIRTASLSVYKHAGHAPHWERPAEVARELTTFAAARMRSNLSRAV